MMTVKVSVMVMTVMMKDNDGYNSYATVDRIVVTADKSDGEVNVMFVYG